MIQRDIEILREDLISLIPQIQILDNWYFPSPINQELYTRWTTESKPSSGAQGNTRYGFMQGYAIDRWKLWTDLTIANAYIDSSGMHINGYNLCQLIEPRLIRYGENYTFSAIVDNTLLTVSGIISSTTSTLYTYGLSLRYAEEERDWALDVKIYDLGGMHTVKAAKLELGDHQTLAYREGNTWVLNDPVPNKAIELLKCQSHYLILPGNSAAYTIAGYAKATNSNQLDLQLNIPIQMRVKPAISMTGNWIVSGASSQKTFSAEEQQILLNSYAPTNIAINIIGSLGLNSNNTYIIQRYNDPTAKIILDSRM